MRGGKLTAGPLEASGRAFSVATRARDDHDKKFCVLADLLIPGKGDPIKNGCLIIEGKKITYAGKASDCKTSINSLPTTKVKVVMPGMWDCHVHMLGLFKLDDSEFVKGAQNMAQTGARGAKDVMLLLNAGFTSVREMAGYGLQLDKAIQEGTIPGPKIYSSNKIIVGYFQAFAGLNANEESTRAPPVATQISTVYHRHGMKMPALMECPCKQLMVCPNA